MYIHHHRLINEFGKFLYTASTHLICFFLIYYHAIHILYIKNALFFYHQWIGKTLIRYENLKIESSSSHFILNFLTRQI